jgi:hypothetical protein
MPDKIIAIYDADLTIAGELSYAIGKLTGTRHCALCDISHGLNPIGKGRWRSYRKLHPAINWLHRNDISDQMRDALPCSLPCVVLQCDSGTLIELMNSADLASCDGDLTTFDQRLNAVLSEHQISIDGALAS